MPITNQILRDGRVMLSTYSASFTAAEVSEMIHYFEQEVLSHATKKVFIVADFTAVKHLPPNILSSTRQWLKKPSPLLGPVIEVTTNDFLHKMISVFNKLSPSYKILAYRTLEEAFAELDRQLALEAQESVPADQVKHPA